MHRHSPALTFRRRRPPDADPLRGILDALGRSADPAVRRWAGRLLAGDGGTDAALSVEANGRPHAPK